MISEKERVYDKNQIDFVKAAPLMGGISIFLVVVSLILIFTKGFRFGIDFAGGTEMQVRFTQPVDAGQVRDFFDRLVGNASVQGLGEHGDEYLVRFEAREGATEEEANQKNNELIEQVTKALLDGMPMSQEGLLRVDAVGPQVGAYLKRDAILSIFYSLIIILVYVGLRFDYRYAPGAVVALFHDAIVTLGIYSLFGLEINVQVLAAVLTIIGYSINDTIVIFDRIRENLGLHRDIPLPALINKSINETLSRTILTSLTTLIAVAALFFLADGVIKDLSLALAIGIILGTYSTIYCASPSLVLIDRWAKKKRQAA
jgi:preprotein translocase subunit SecF